MNEITEALPPGSAFGYARADTSVTETRPVTLPNGRVVQVPVNARNVWSASTPQPQADSMDAFYQQLRDRFGNLPIEEAKQAYQAALTFQGLRGYQGDMQKGMPAAEAFAKWMPVFGAAGLMKMAAPKAQPSISPYQQATLDLAKQRFALEQQKANKPKVEKPKFYKVGDSGIVQVLPDGTVKTLREPIAPMTLGEKALQQDELGELMKQRETLNLTVPKPTVIDKGPWHNRINPFGSQPKEVPNPEYSAATNEIGQLEKRIREFGAKPRATVTAPTNAPAATGKRIRVKSPQGIKGTIPESQREEAKKAGYTLYAD